MIGTNATDPAAVYASAMCLNGRTGRRRINSLVGVRHNHARSKGVADVSVWDQAVDVLRESMMH